MLIAGHRGSCYDAPENTLASMNMAWRDGAPVAEIDVHLSKDGRVMVMHDASTLRTTGIDLKISETGSAKLRELDAGAFKGEQFRGEKIPLLEEVLETILEGRKLLVEVKCGPEILPVIKGILDATGRASQVIIISFNLQVCAESRKLMPSIPVMLLWGATRDPETGNVIEHSLKHIETAKEHSLDGLDMHFSGVTQGFADAVRGAGLMLYVWTVNDLDEARRLRGLGVDAVATDRPGWMLRELRV